MGESFDLRDLTWRGRADFAAHVWKSAFRQSHGALLPLLACLLPKNGVVFDVGAHGGQFARLFAGLVPAGRVYAFEPGSYARRVLRLTLAARGLGHVTVVPLALSDAAGTARLSVPLKRGGAIGYGLGHLGDGGGRAERSETVETTTLDAAMRQLGAARLDFLKVDVEGWEGRVMAGAAETLARHRPAIMAELIGGHLARAGDDLAGVWARLAGLGYVPRLVDSGLSLPVLAAPRDGEILWLPEGREI